MRGWSANNPDDKNTICGSCLEHAKGALSPTSSDQSGSASNPRPATLDVKHKTLCVYDYASSSLGPMAYYDSEADDPIVLFAMSYGTEWEVDPSKDDAFKKLVSAHGKKKVVPESNVAVLKREGQRRAKVLGITKPTNRNHSGPKVQAYLKETAAEEERAVVVAMINNLRDKCETDALQSSHSHLLLRLRKFSALLDPSIRDDMINRNVSPDRRLLDGRNSPDRPDTYYDKAAALFNSAKVFQSSPMPDLGEPFDNINDLHPPNQDVLAKDMKQFLTEIRAQIGTVRAACGGRLQRREYCLHSSNTFIFFIPNS
jgi:hypothetical protein